MQFSPPPLIKHNNQYPITKQYPILNNQISKLLIIDNWLLIDYWLLIISYYRKKFLLIKPKRIKYRSHYKKFNPSKSKRTWVNEEIRLPQVAVIDETGKSLGVMPTYKAIALAKEGGFDLVEVAANIHPPVCKFLDFGKYKYQKEKQEQQQKKKARKVEIKGVRISPRISQNDLEFKAKQADKFLDEGNKVRIEIVIKGRENAHIDLVNATLHKFVDTIKTKIKVEQQPKRQRLGMAMVVAKA